MRAGDRLYRPPELPPARCLADLTARQQEIARLIAAGHHPTALARLLGIHPWTAKNHLTAIYARCGLSGPHGNPRLKLALWVWRQEGVPS